MERGAIAALHDFRERRLPFIAGLEHGPHEAACRICRSECRIRFASPVVKPSFYDNLRQILITRPHHGFHPNGAARAQTFRTLHTTSLKTVARGRIS